MRNPTDDFSLAQVKQRRYPEDALVSMGFRMNALEKNIAVARGEALAASLLATAALQTSLLMISNRQEFLSRIEAFIEGTLDLSGPGGGDANDEPNFLMREAARNIAMQQLDAIKRMIVSPPTG